MWDIWRTIQKRIEITSMWTGTFTKQCRGRYTDAFAISMVENQWQENDLTNITPIKIP